MMVQAIMAYYNDRRILTNQCASYNLIFTKLLNVIGLTDEDLYI